MCELLGVTAAQKIRVNELFNTFFSHSIEHRNGWGLVLFDEEPLHIDRGSEKAVDSSYLKSRLEKRIETSGCIAHIRKATIGEVKLVNTHPFSNCDDSGRQWILAHNGTIFDSDVLAPYQYVQEGSTDSERILLYIVDEINKLYHDRWIRPSGEERIRVVEDAIHSIVPGNKLNLMLYDGELFYIHKNDAGTLYKKELEEGIVFATKPLDNEVWTEFPLNRLMVYKDGKQVYTGRAHDWTYIHNEENMRMLYFDYSGL